MACFADAAGRDVFAAVVEVQRSPDERKRFSWPVYHSTVRARLECDTVLMVLCFDRATAAWARAPILTGHPEYVLSPLVVGPDEFPVITDEERARAQPEISALSALAHGADPACGEAVLLAFAQSLRTLPDDRLAVYHDYVVAGLAPAARAHWEALMSTGTYEFQTEFARRYHGRGKSEGRAEGEAEALLAVLGARGIDLTERHRGLISSCTDPERLREWIVRAATATRAEQVFG